MGQEAFLAAQILDFAEATDDRVAALLQAGTGITLTYNDGSGTLTIASTVSPTWGSISGTLSSQTDLQTVLDGKSNVGHGHAISDITSLQTALDAKLNLSGGNVTGQIEFSGSGSGLGLAQLRSSVSNWFIYSGGTFQSPLFNCNGWFGMVDGASGGLQFFSGHGIVWSGTGTSGTLTRNSLAGDVGIYRVGSGQLDIRGNSGLRLRNYANSADSPLTASSATFSALVTVGTYTVATIPSAAANPGGLAQVTDSSVTANGSEVAGGGANRVMVFSNGSTWDVVVA